MTPVAVRLLPTKLPKAQAGIVRALCRTMGVHDSLFKMVFSDPKNAAGLLNSILPSGLLKHLDLSMLAGLSSALADARSEFAADLLFEAKRQGQPVLVSILLEHQSTRHATMPLRLSPCVREVTV